MFDILSIIILVNVIVSPVIQAAANKQQTCYAHDENFYPYFSTRTAYEFVHDEIFRLNRTDCSPTQIWMLARHGARYPDKNVLMEMLDVVQIKNRIIESYESGAGRLCSNEVDLLRGWQLNSNFHLDSAQLLAPQGKENLRLLAYRLRKNFPELLTSKSKDYIFRATDTQRTRASMKAFVDGLFDVATLNDSSNIGYAVSARDDALLLAHKNCREWVKNYFEENGYVQRDEFTKGPEMKALINNFSQRFGFTVNFRIVKNMYDMCRYETSWHLRKPSIWCRLFTIDELKVMEYREDLELYYLTGPGRDINVKLGCRTLSDMMEHFENLVVKSVIDQPRGIFYFAHTQTLQALMSTFHINEDVEPLLASKYAKSHNRNFRTSLMGPFGTNIVAVFYNCSDNDESSYKISFHVAEKSVKLPICKDVLCDWELLREQFSSTIEQCSNDSCDGTIENHRNGVGALMIELSHWIILIIMIVAIRLN